MGVKVGSASSTAFFLSSGARRILYYLCIAEILLVRTQLNF